MQQMQNTPLWPLLGREVIPAENEDGMKALAVPNQKLFSQCLLVTLRDSVLVMFVSYNAR